MGAGAQVTRGTLRLSNALLVSATQMVNDVLKGHDFSRAANGPQ